MKQYFVFLIALLALLLFFGCTQEPGSNNSNPAACTQEAKLCSDGSSVGRTGPNCEFAPCPFVPVADKNMDLVGQKRSCSSCPVGYVSDGNVCNPNCYSKNPPCLKPSISCKPDSVKIANPASTNCIDKNGTLEIVDTNQGQIGMCTLPNGNVCEEWALFRNECN